MILRPYQIEAREKARDLFSSGHRGVILAAPTGFGKTLSAADIAALAVSKGRRVLFMAHREELVNQAAAKITEAGVDNGIIMANRSMNLMHLVQVASVQTLVRRMDRLQWKPDLIIIDECHLAGAKSYSKIVSFYGSPPLLGLSATPIRMDGRSLGVDQGGLFDSIVITAGTGDLIRQGYLSPFKYFAPSRPDLSGVHIQNGDYNPKEAAAVVDQPTIVGNAIEHWRQHAIGRPTVVFAVSVKHSQHVAAEFQKIGAKAVAISGTSPPDERRAAVDGIKSGSIDVLVNCCLLVEGVDFPNVSCIILLAPTRSITRYLQSVGRGLRTNSGKKDCIILDHAGCVHEHGLPDEPRQWDLSGSGPRRRKSAAEDVIALKTCEKCYGCFKPAPKCPLCGFIFPIEGRKVKEVDGQLVELTSTPGRTPEQVQAAGRRQEVGMAKDRQKLEQIARERGYKPAWVEYVLQSRAKTHTKNEISEFVPIRTMMGMETNVGKPLKLALPEPVGVSSESELPFP